MATKPRSRADRRALVGVVPPSMEERPAQDEAGRDLEMAIESSGAGVALGFDEELLERPPVHHLAAQADPGSEERLHRLALELRESGTQDRVRRQRQPRRQADADRLENRRQRETPAVEHGAATRRRVAAAA